MKQMNFQKAIYFYRTAVMIMPPEEGKEAVDLARELARSVLVVLKAFQQQLVIKLLSEVEFS